MSDNRCGGHPPPAWIGNSRNPAEEQVLRVLASMAGFRLDTAHEADLPQDRPVRAGVTVVPLTAPGVRHRTYAVTRRGRASWPPVALVLAQVAGSAVTATHPPTP